MVFDFFKIFVKPSYATACKECGTRTMVVNVGRPDLDCSNTWRLIVNLAYSVWSWTWHIKSVRKNVLKFSKMRPQDLEKMSKNCAKHENRLKTGRRQSFWDVSYTKMHSFSRSTGSLSPNVARTSKMQGQFFSEIFAYFSLFFCLTYSIFRNKNQKKCEKLVCNI